MTRDGAVWYEPHGLMHLTVKRGKHAGASVLYCTCGWEQMAPDLDETKRLGDQHNGLCGSSWMRPL